MTELLVEDLEESIELEKFKKKLKGLTRKALFNLSETIRKDIDKMTRDLATRKEKRENYNREAKGWKEKRDAAIGVSSGELQELRNQAEEYKKLRDAINEQIQILKQQREQLTEKIRREWTNVRQFKDDFRELQAEIGPVPDKIHEEIERLEWKQQTTPNLSLEEENVLISYITELYRKVVSASTLNKAYEQLQEAITYAKNSIAERENIHAQIVELAEESQKYHELMLQTYQQMDEFRAKGVEFHEKYLTARKNADAVHKEVVILLERIKTARQKVNLVTEERDLRTRQKILEKTSQERETAEKKLAAGSRLTLDELRMLLDSKPKE
ncbi:MAG: coiled-coil protein [Candidatus Heimdallarchaeota archaeon]